MLDTAGVVVADLATVTAVHPPPVTAEPTEPACSVCEVALVRASGVPPAVLDGLCVPRTSAALIDLAAAEQVLATLSDRVEEALFALVPQLDDDPHLRRRVLTLKRNVHNRRSPGIETATCDDIERRLASGDAAHLHTWLVHAAVRDRAEGVVDEELPAELARAARMMVSAVRDETLLRGLALASPSFTTDLLTQPSAADLRPGARFARTAVSYLARAAVKTSPFSSLTQVSVALVSTGHADRTHRGLPSAPASDPQRRVVLGSVALAREWLLACAREPALAAALRYRARGGLRQLGDRLLTVLPAYSCDDGFFIAPEQLVDVGLYAQVLSRLADLGPHASYQETLAVLPGTQPEATFLRLLQMGLLDPVAPWAAHSTNPTAELADLAAAAASGASEVDAPTVALYATRLRQLADAHECLPTTAARHRPALLEHIRTVSEEGLNERGAAPPWLASAPLVHEDMAADLTAPNLGPAVHADLVSVARMLQATTIRTRLYDHLLGHAVARFGSGGSGDLLSFLYSFVERPDAHDLFRDSLAEDTAALRAPHRSRAPVETGRSTARPSATLFVQVAASDVAAVQRGEYLLVVNQTNPGLGGLFARFSQLPGSESVAATLKQWAAQLVPDARPVELPISADWSSLQARGRGILPTLRWPSEAPMRETDSSLSLDSLRLVHDAGTGTLTIVAGDGEPVAPLYLGTVPPYVLYGPVRLLLTLVDPWMNGVRFGTHDFSRRSRPSAPHHVTLTPRHSSGRVVLQRAQWRVPPGQMPIQERGETIAAFVRRADRWRRQHHLPTEVFLSVEQRTVSHRPNRRKPIWLSFDSPHSLAAAAGLLDSSTVAVLLTEALPARDQHWIQTRDGTTRAAEFLTLVSWSARALEHHAAVTSPQP